MTKLLGITLILSSVIALFAGAIVGQVGDEKPQITGNLLSNIIEQPRVSMGFFDYLQAIVFSYSLLSLIMGLIFIIRV